MNVAALQTIRNAGNTILDQLNDHGGCLRRNVGRKIGQHRSIVHAPYRLSISQSLTSRTAPRVQE